MTAVFDVTQTKLCKRCNQTKPHSEFFKNTKAKDGLNYYCKPCSKDIHKITQHRKSQGKEIENRADAFVAGLIDPSELTYEELTGGYIELGGRGGGSSGVHYPVIRLPKPAITKFNNELSRRVNQFIREKATRAVEIIFEIADSDLVEPADRLKAATWLAERVIGKTPEIIQMNVETKPYESVFETMETTSRDDHRKAIGQAIDAEVVELPNHDSEGANSKTEIMDGSEQQGSSSDFRSDGQYGVFPSNEGNGESKPTAEELAESIDKKRNEAKELRKRIAQQKKRRYAARAVGATSLDAAPWLINWRVCEKGLQACLVAPDQQTPAKLAVIDANEEATNDPKFIAQQRANKAQAKADRIRAKLEKLKGNPNGAS